VRDALRRPMALPPTTPRGPASAPQAPRASQARGPQRR
jgi:hypothetical protein